MGAAPGQVFLQILFTAYILIAWTSSWHEGTQYLLKRVNLVPRFMSNFCLVQFFKDEKWLLIIKKKLNQRTENYEEGGLFFFSLTEVPRKTKMTKTQMTKSI